MPVRVYTSQSVRYFCKECTSYQLDAKRFIFFFCICTYHIALTCLTYYAWVCVRNTHKRRGTYIIIYDTMNGFFFFSFFFHHVRRIGVVYAVTFSLSLSLSTCRIPIRYYYSIITLQYVFLSLSAAASYTLYTYIPCLAPSTGDLLPRAAAGVYTEKPRLRRKG